MHLKNTYPRGRSKDILVQRLKNETLIYSLKTSKALCLNETATFVFEKCDGKTSVCDIADSLTRKTNKPVSENFIWMAINQLCQDGLLENCGELKSPLDGMSRREVIKRIGLGSAVSFPIISSVVAPSALLAQSMNCTVAPFDSSCQYGGVIIGLCSTPGCIAACTTEAATSCVSNTGSYANTCVQNGPSVGVCVCTCD